MGDKHLNCHYSCSYFKQGLTVKDKKSVASLMTYQLQRAPNLQSRYHMSNTLKRAKL